VRTLDGDDGKQVDLTAHLGDLDNGGEAGEASTNDDDFWRCHYESDLYWDKLY
jgi:hypothetical protein